MILCPHHTQVYATRAKALEGTRHPDAVEALARDTLVIARQCRLCPEEWK